MRITILIALFSLSIAKQGNTQNLSNNQFAIDFYKQIAIEEKGNILFSPFSLSVAMGMTYAGTKGVSQEQIGNVFHFTSNDDKFHIQLGNTIKQINSKVGPIQLKIVNTLWAEKTFPFKQSYNTLLKKAYLAAVKPMDFINKFEQSRLAINDNVYKATNEKIKDLLPPNSLNNLTRLVLTNAIYFKGDWKTMFKKELTSDRDFFIAPKKAIKCSMMSVKGDFNYYEDSKLQALELPYIGGNFSMVVILPFSKISLEEITKILSNDILDDIVRELNEQEVTISIPKFKLSNGYQLKQMLSKMGMPQPFTDDADFTGMTTASSLKISDVFHKAFIEVNEQGTEASAATAVVVATKSVHFVKSFIANRPFLFLIKEKSTGTILFMGRVVDPTKSE
ncbi:MAG: serpin family protein [Bacteroidales bacterium]|nr:MAG: serpin family protein [Bacteroidales bacterium]